MADEQKKGSFLTDTAAGKGGAAVAKKLVTRAFGATTGALSGGAGYVAAEVGSRAATLINKHKGTLLAGTLGLVAAPFLAVAAAVGAVATAGLASLGSALIIALITVPVVVALFMVIINNSAYLVPPSSYSTAGVVESRYLSVTKEPNPEGPFENEALPLEVEYTITVTAKEGILNNLSLGYECVVASKSGNQNCPPTPTLPTLPASISVGEPFTFSYTMQYDNTYIDSLVTDTIRVTATAPNGETTTASGSASIIIGDPPTECFEFQGWPEDEKAQQIKAITEMVTTAPSFSARLCAGGPIILLYSTEQVSWGGWHMGNRRILIYPNGRGSLPNRYYTLTHEVGHVYGAAYRSNLYQYRDDPSVRGEAPICTYPLSVHPWFEDYAEMIALFLTQGNPTSIYRDFNCLNGQTFKDRYPIHWQWTRDNIIMDDLGW